MGYFGSCRARDGGATDGALGLGHRSRRYRNRGKEEEEVPVEVVTAPGINGLRGPEGRFVGLGFMGRG